MRQLIRFLLYAIVGGLLLSGCQKKVESVQENMLVKLIVSSEWAITKYMKGTVEITGDFSPYSFQFNKDFTVDALNNNIVEKTGTWNGDIATKTINSNFPNPNPILALLNGTWLVTDSGLTYVEAKQTINGENCFMRMVKK
jgi:hypothetical protein